MTPGKEGAAEGGLCDGCGICCRTFALPPFDANEVVQASDELVREIEEYARSSRYRATDPCFWQDPVTKKCRHHDVRPTLCRWFEPGCPACSKLRVQAGLEPLSEGHAAKGSAG